MEALPAKQSGRYNPLNDFLFLKTMGEKGDEEQLLGFLNAVLDKSGKNRIASVEIIENRILTPEVLGDKLSILDVLAVLQDGSRINIEVQLRNDHNMEKRSLFYWSREFVNSLKEGQDYKELRRVIAINIINFELFNSEDFHTCYHLKEDNDGAFLTDALEIHFVDMEKWRNLSYKDIQGNPLHRWLVWLDPKSPLELVEEVIKMDTAIQKAQERQDYVLSYEDAQRIYNIRQKARWDYISATNYAREEGRKEGLEDGLKEGKEAVARKALAEGLSLEFVQKITGLDIETLEKL